MTESETRSKAGGSLPYQGTVMTEFQLDRIAPTRRPAGKAIGYQSWRDLTFVHWRVDAAVVQSALPSRLTVDVHDGSAWLGLVPFAMRNVRPWWSPSVPGVSNFLETNLRTYVHCDGVPGVWFFSLDAASSLAVRIARWQWSLPYFKAAMTLTQADDVLHYAGTRRWPEPANAEYDMQIRRGESLTDAATPDTLEHFLAERYVLFAGAANETLKRGIVHHRPYPLHHAELLECQQTVSAAAGFAIESVPDHVCFSPGVDVEIFPLKPLGANS